MKLQYFKKLKFKSKILVLFLASFYQLNAQHVYFGERTLSHSKIIAIHFDQEGNIYPDFYIADSALQNCQHSLANWYEKHPKDLQIICDKYVININENKFNINQLNDSIATSHVNKINRKKSNSVTFLVHGYRKSFIAPEGTVTSVMEFNLLEKNLDSLGLTTQYVEVYWDGTYDCCFSLIHGKKNRYLFSQFEVAQKNAPNVGLSLRRIITQINAQKINLIGHSLGAKVVASALFNLQNNAIETPSQSDIRICLIAPAIGGIEIFSHYLDRNSSLNFREKDNYRSQILYNQKDFALRKKDSKMRVFGPGCYRYGNTTLGCNHRKEIKKVNELFIENYPNSQITFEDMSWMGKKHSLKYYAEGNNLINAVLFLYQN